MHGNYELGSISCGVTREEETFVELGCSLVVGKLLG